MAARPRPAAALPGCGTIVDQLDRFCVPCWSGLDFLGERGCRTCGLPLEATDAETCAGCLAHPPRIARTRAAVAYGEASRSLVLRLKYGRKVALAKAMAVYMSPLLGGPPEGAVLLPVPLHRWRLATRGFNQSLVARELGRLRGLPIASRALRRTRVTPSLKGMNFRQRRRTMAGAFRVADAAAIEGRTVVLVDDVLTTGSTANACARALLKAGAARVELLCWARWYGSLYSSVRTADDKETSVAKVEIYTKSTCPYCTRAKQLLDHKGVEKQEFSVDMGGPKKQEMVQRAGGRTSVPQIFIDGKHIGGCDDLMALDRAGKLDELLAA